MLQILTLVLAFTFFAPGDQQTPPVPALGDPDTPGVSVAGALFTQGETDPPENQGGGGGPAGH